MAKKNQSQVLNVQLFRNVFDESPVGIALENLEGELLFVNPALCAMLGFSLEEMGRKRRVEFSPREDAEKDWELFQQLRAGVIDHYQLERRYLREDGSSVWGHLTVCLLKTSPSPLVVALVAEMTDERTLQDRKHASLEMLDLVTKQMAAAVTRCSRDFRYEWVNQAYADWLQRPISEITGRPIVEVLGNEGFETLLPHFKRVLSGKDVHFEQEATFQGIGRRLISATYVPTFDTNGGVDGWVAVVLDNTERKREEGARYRHAAVVESYEDAIISKNLDAIITSWNIGAERIFGYTEGEAIGKPITILIPPELLDEEQKILERLRAGGRIEHYETKRITKEGKRVDVSLTIGPVRDSSGAIVGFTKIAHDITQQKQAQDAVKESESRFRLVADTAPVLIWMSGVDKLCTYFNKPWLDFTGRSFEEEYGNGWAEGIHPDDLQRCLDTYRQSFDRREKFRMEYRLRRHDGQYRWVLDVGVPRLNQNGSFAGYIGIAIDISEKKETEEALLGVNRTLEHQTAVLQSREELLKTFVKNVPAGVAMFDRKMCYLQVSDRWCSDYGVNASEILGRSHYEVFPEIPERWREMHRLGFAGETLRCEEDRWNHNGSTTWVQWEIRPWKNFDGSVEGILIFAEDITRRKQMEEAISAMSGNLIRSQEDERRRLARELHDDINQRLALLAVQIRQLQDDSRMQPEVSNKMDALWRDIAEISTDLQSLSHRLHSSKLEYLGAVAAMKSWCKEFGARQRMEISFKEDVSSTLPYEIGLCLFRVLQEALHNALKHSGGKQIKVELQEYFNEVHLLVSDSGRGFDVDAARSRTGLGLTSMQERVRMVKGTIVIKSEPKTGTTILVRIPFESGREPQQAAG